MTTTYTQTHKHSIKHARQSQCLIDWINSNVMMNDKPAKHHIAEEKEENKYLREYTKHTKVHSIHYAHARSNDG